MPYTGPDASKLTGAISQWLPIDLDREWESGDQILAAIPRHSRNGRSWHYQYIALTIKCDEHYLELECSHCGESSALRLEDVDFYVEL
jgi:hypothetical protein